MAYEIPTGRTLDTSFMFTKLLVHDLDKAASFYASVIGLVEMHRLEAVIGGRPVSEIVYMPTHTGGPLFILARFHDTVSPPGGETILGFPTDDLDALLERATNAGGQIVEAAHDVPEAGMRVAFVADGEGHLLEITQMLG